MDKIIEAINEEAEEIARRKDVLLMAARLIVSKCDDKESIKVMEAINKIK